MTAPLHWELRKHLKELRDDGRLAVLTALILHANIRLRCWPCSSLLVSETDWSTAAVTASKKWLQEHGAYVLVPFGARVDEECNLPPRQHIYQLTGILKVDDQTTIQYLYMNPEAREAVEAAVSRALAKVSPSKTSPSKTSPSEILLGKTEGISIPKGNTSLEGNPKGEDTRPRFKCWVQHGERYADGVLIDVTAPDFETACNAIFHAWLDVLTEFRARPDTELDDLWSKHRPAVVALAKNRRTPEQVAAFMRDAYNDPKDDFWRNPLKLIPVMAISNGFSAWLAQSTPKPAAPPAQPAGQQSTPDLTGHNQILEALKRKAAENGSQS